MNGLGRNKEKKENKSLVFTRETLGVVLILFATLCLVCLITRETVFSVIGQSVNAFLFGCFGFFAYAVLLFLIILGVVLISGKKTGLSLRRKVLLTFTCLIIALIAHIATVSSANLNFGDYLIKCYAMGEGGIATTSAGGLTTGLIAYVLCALLTGVGSYVLLGLAVAVVGFLLVADFVKDTQKAERKPFRSSFVKEEDLDVEIAGEKEYPVAGVDFSTPSGKQRLFVNNPEDFAVKNKREMQKDEANPNGIKINMTGGGLGVVGAYKPEIQKAPQTTDDYKKKLDYIKTPAVIDMEKYNTNQYNGNSYTSPNPTYTGVSDFVKQRLDAQGTGQNEYSQPSSPIVNANSDSAEARAQIFGDRYLGITETEITSEVQTPDEQVYSVNLNKDEPEVEYPSNRDNREEVQEIPFIDESEEEQVETIKEQEIETEQTESDYSALERAKSLFEKEEDKPAETNVTANRRLRNIFLGDEQKDSDENKDTENVQSLGFTSRVSADDNLGIRRRLGLGEEKEQVQEEQVEPKPEKKPVPINREYFRPPFDLLETYAQPLNAVQENHQERMEIIQRTLEDFHINAVPQNYVQGPSITRYEIMMPAGISVKKVLSYDDDLKMRLSAKSGVRIEAPIPGKNLVGIEVANSVKVTVGLKEVMEGLADKKSKPGSLMFALGKDIVGNAISDDLTKGPHFLIAGATGSGKSVALHVMLVSLLMRYSPEELKLVLVDPKCVEFRKYEHIPHLLVDEIINEPKRALTLLQWAYDETNRRNEMFTACGGHISNIDDYNSMVANDTVPKLARIVFVIDELADLMEACKKDLEERIRKIAAKSRSAGIHLVLATQRPSVDVITGTIKANLPSRIALKVMNFADSQTILGGAGAEKLLGNGDMLYKNSSMGDYERYQGAYISGREIANIVEYIKSKNTAYFDEDVQEFLDKETKPKPEESPSEAGENGGGDEFSEFFLKALWLAVNTETISISLLQRRFQIGYARAGGLVDKMERMGFISGNEGGRARRVLMSKEDFVSRFGPMDEAY